MKDDLAARLIRELQQRTAKCLVPYRDNDDTIRCRRVQGHDGRHLDGYLMWGEDGRG